MTYRKVKPEAQVESTFACQTCSKAFPTQFALGRHFRRNHKGAKFQCYYCDYETKFKVCLSRHVPLHLKKKDITRPSGTYVKCPLCEFGCVIRETMLEHYVNEHDVDMMEQNYEFQDTEDFSKWKYQIEQADVCQFTCRSKKNRGAVLVRYFRCFRDGVFLKKGRGIRNLKLKGSVKINGICPAGFKAEEDRTTGVIKVAFVRSHVGHSKELGRMNLSKHERADIARKLSMGMSIEDIIGSIRGSMDAEVKRLHLTTFKDVWNVQCSYGLRKAKKKREGSRKTTKDSRKYIQTNNCQITLENISKSGPPAPDFGSDDNICLPTETINTPGHALQPQQQHSTSIETSGTDAWNMACHTAQLPGPMTFCSVQNVPERTNVVQSSDNAAVEVCESSCDNDDNYFEMMTTVDSRQMPLGKQLNDKKIEIRTKVEEILESIKTEEHADMFFNELLRVQNTIEAHSSISGHFNH